MLCLVAVFGLARSAGRDGGTEFNGFVDWVREHAGASQPYIVAIDDRAASPEDAMSSAAANPGCNAVMPTPADDRAMEERNEGRPGNAYEMLAEEFERNATDLDIALALWDTASSSAPTPSATAQSASRSTP